MTKKEGVDQVQPIHGGYDETHTIRWDETLARVTEVILERERLGESCKILALGSDGQFESKLKTKFPSVEITISDWDLRYKFPVLDEEFDIVMSFEVIEHLKDQNINEDIASHYFTGLMSFLSESNRALRNNGLLILTTPNASSYRALKNTLKGASAYMYWPHVRELAPFELSFFLGVTGFEVNHMDSFSPYHDDFEKTNKKYLPVIFGLFENLLYKILGSQQSLKNLRGSTLFAISKKRNTPNEVLLSTEWHEVRRSNL